LLQMSSQKSDVSSQRGKQKLPRLRLTPFSWPFIAAVTAIAAGGINSTADSSSGRAGTL